MRVRIDDEKCEGHGRCYGLAPELFETRRGAIRVVSEGLAFGQTIQKPADRSFPPGAWDNRPQHTICTNVDSEQLRRLYARTLRLLA